MLTILSAALVVLLLLYRNYRQLRGDDRLTGIASLTAFLVTSSAPWVAALVDPRQEMAWFAIASLVLAVAANALFSLLFGTYHGVFRRRWPVLKANYGFAVSSVALWIVIVGVIALENGEALPDELQANSDRPALTSPLQAEKADSDAGPLTGETQSPPAQVAQDAATNQTGTDDSQPSQETNEPQESSGPAAQSDSTIDLEGDTPEKPAAVVTLVTRPIDAAILARTGEGQLEPIGFGEAQLTVESGTRIFYEVQVDEGRGFSPLEGSMAATTDQTRVLELQPRLVELVLVSSQPTAFIEAATPSSDGMKRFGEGTATLEVPHGAEIRYRVVPQDGSPLAPTAGTIVVHGDIRHVVELGLPEYQLHLAVEPAEATIELLAPGLETQGQGSVSATVPAGTEVRYIASPNDDVQYQRASGTIVIEDDVNRTIDLPRATADVLLSTEPDGAPIAFGTSPDELENEGLGQVTTVVPIGEQLYYRAGPHREGLYGTVEGSIVVREGTRHEINLPLQGVAVTLRTEPSTATLQVSTADGDLLHEGPGEVTLKLQPERTITYRAEASDETTHRSTEGAFSVLPRDSTRVIELPKVQVDFTIVSEPISAPIFASVDADDLQHVGTGSATLQVDEGALLHYEIRPSDGSGYETFTGSVEVVAGAEHPVWLPLAPEPRAQAPRPRIYDSPSGRPAPTPGTSIHATPRYVVNFIANELELTDVACPVQVTDIMLCGYTRDSETLVRNVVDGLFEIYLQPANQVVSWRRESSSGSLVGAYTREEGPYFFSISTSGPGPGVVSIGYERP